MVVCIERHFGNFYACAELIEHFLEADAIFLEADDAVQKVTCQMLSHDSSHTL